MTRARVAGLAVLALACTRSSTRPHEERGVAHCERDLAAARVCVMPRPSDGERKRDRDRDGLPDAHDCCPKLPEDPDGFEDQDGCPDCDDDRDGILDAEWLLVERRRTLWTSAEGYFGRRSCGAWAEDFDGVDDHDGCPEGVEITLDSLTCAEVIAIDRKPTASLSAGVVALERLTYVTDTDADGYDDGADECRNAPEDFDGFEDDDGCPDCDNDHDGIPDADTWVLFEYGPNWANRDRIGEIDCRNEPEDLDGIEDHDGCPEQ